MLRKRARPASWNKATDPDQIELREYLDDTADLLRSAKTVDRACAMRLDVGLPEGRDLTDTADLDNYAYPLAAHLLIEGLVSVWRTKRHAEVSRILLAPAQETTLPPTMFCVRTTASSQTTAYKEQVRSAVVGVAEIPAGPVRVELSFAVGPRWNWLNLWKPTIDALDPVLGRTRADRDWHPKDGRITDLALHRTMDVTLGNDIVVSIAAGPAG
ncbi:hypothetical protein [Spirillospora sp. CA-294931]|uniref:hypothetical protein n=1 Tax=Spirillospora sp. CA-294931 TaxID=3240042 RepID=UPI003D8B9174